MRLATFNLLNGRSLDDGRVDLDRLQQGIASLDADVLALQEVDCDQPRSHGADLTALAAEAMGAAAHRFAPTMAGLPGTWQPAAGAAQGPRYGVALLSRWPVRRWEVLQLDAVPVVVPLVVGPRRLALVRDEPRAALVAVVAAPDGDVTVVSTHLSFVPGWGTRQLRRVARHVRAAPGRIALLGDLNAGPRAVQRASRLTPLVSAATFPAPRPLRQLDHVLVRGLVGRHARALELPLSDHRALVVDVAPAG